MANTWGSLAWGEGNFGEQSNITVPVTGIGGNPIAWNSGAFGSASFGGQSNSIPLSLSEETVTGEINSGWGRLTWGENPWGIYGTTLTSGQQLNLSTGNLDAVGEINEGWGRLTWGENAWGAAGDVLLQGLSLSVSTEGNQDAFGQLEWSAYNTRWGGVGSVDIAISQEINVSGQQLNVSQGEESATGTTVAYINNTNLGLGVAKGTTDPAPDVMLTGIGLTANLGIVDSYNEQGWGRDDWGTEVWGAQGIWSFVDVTGESLGVNSGVQETWGQDEWGATTTEWGGTSITDVDISVNVELSTEYNPGWGAVAFGEQTWGIATEDMALAMPQPGAVDPEPDVSLTGNQVNIGLGEETIVGTANVFLTGFGLTLSQGNAELDAVTFAQTSGQELEVSLNNAVAGASAEVFPTGNELTITSGSINVQSWQIVDTGTNVNWNIIDTAA
jgi:hypothetical protein